jgi:hypothetical protein
MMEKTIKYLKSLLLVTYINPAKAQTIFADPVKGGEQASGQVDFYGKSHF